MGYQKKGAGGGDARKRLGGDGEDVAARHLLADGYRILERNYRCRYGEVDLIAADGDTLVFVEVKLRYAPVDALEAVDERKQLQVSKAAIDFLMRRCMLGKPARFDVVAVEGHTRQCVHIKDAFECSLSY